MDEGHADFPTNTQSNSDKWTDFMLQMNDWLENDQEVNKFFSHVFHAKSLLIEAGSA